MGDTVSAGCDRDTFCSASRMASSPTQMETDGGGPTVAGAPPEPRGASPTKKQRGDEAQPVTLELIREAMRMELGRNREELNQAVATVREEVALFGQRVDSIESGVTKQMDTTNKMLSIITSNHDKQTEAVSLLREEQRQQAESMKTFREGQDQLEKRLALLENKLRGTSTAANSTADTEASRRPALILGGWPDDQAAADTLKKAKDILRQLDVPLDYSDMFVPGLKRGYAIIPLVQTWGETEDARREQVQATLQKVRHANVMLGRGPDVQHRKLWLSMSQSPERRREARLAGKVKRAMLEMGAQAAKLEVEFSTGTVWYGGERFSSATLDMPKGGEPAGAGWVRLDLMAKALHKPLAEVQLAWHPRKEELR